MPTFLLTGLFDPDASQRFDVENSGVFLEHLKQLTPRIKLEGLLHNPADERVGVFFLIECDDWAAAEKFVAGSPYTVAGLYRQTLIHRVQIQTGRLAD